MKRRFKFKENLSQITVFFIVFVAIFVVFNIKEWEKKGRVIEWDVISYYAYLPAAFIYDDVTLEFMNERTPDQNYTIWPKYLPNNKRVIKTAMGASILYSPYFFLAHLYASNFTNDAGGYSPPYKFALIMNCITFLWLGLFFLRKLLRTKFGEITTSLSMLFVVFGTNLFEYASYGAPLTHTYSFALFAMFMYLSIKWHASPKIGNTILLGLLSGLIALVRPTNVIVLLFFREP